jgi:CheY-like chemotaxis protein
MSSLRPQAKPTILIVEDDLDLLKMLVRMLEPIGDVVTATNGADALERILAGMRPDLIVTDVMMPRMDGLELARRLRNEPKTAKTPVIMLTAKNAPLDVIKGINAGARSYLTKPFKHEELVSKVKKALRLE